MRPIVLASTSSARRHILDQLGLDFVAIGSGVDEAAVTHPSPEGLALLLAQAKARAVAARTPGAWVIGCDQVAYDPSTPGCWGKPRDADDHLARLLGERGRLHVLASGWCVVGPEGEQAGVALARLWMRADLEEAELRAYVTGGEGSACAGGYAVEGRGGALFERIEGDHSTILGLPIGPVIGALRAWGWRMPGGAP